MTEKEKLEELFDEIGVEYDSDNLTTEISLEAGYIVFEFTVSGDFITVGVEE